MLSIDRLMIKRSFSSNSIQTGLWYMSPVSVLSPVFSLNLDLFGSGYFDLDLLTLTCLSLCGGFGSVMTWSLWLLFVSVS